MLKYILLLLISGLLIAPYWIEPLLADDLLSSAETICTRLTLVLLAILILKKESLGHIYKNTLFSIILVVNSFFLLNYVSVIMTDYSRDKVYFINELGDEQK